MEISPRHPEFAGAAEAIEARAWSSLAAVTAVEPLFDKRGVLAATALFSDSTYPLANRVLGVGLERPVQAELLDRILDLYDTRNAESIFVPMAPTARPSTLPRLLKERGFEPAMKEAKLYRSTLNPPEVDSRERVVEAKDEDHEVVLNLYRSGGMQSDWAEVMAGNLGTPFWHHYMALDGDRPVALASMYASQGIALCYPGWTLPGHRHRGYQRALASHRIAAAAELGCGWVTANLDVTDNPIGFSIRSYTRLGFELLYVRTTHIRHRPNVPLPTAYSRRLLVPHN
ncbi:MAG TPA: GNAT family N-acetyltransferase [Dehalococcoidia bacterium]|nr:GNAT family N-acetyltransferase [Dehalococcoidia bacterium]